MALIERLTEYARRLKRETFALYLAARDPRTPRYVKVLVAAVVAYAFSPIDLIPDFIPILGYLDDLILLPLGIALAIRLIPPTVLADCRKRARENLRKEAPVSRRAAAVVISVWVIVAALSTYWLYGILSR